MQTFLSEPTAPAAALSTSFLARVMGSLVGQFRQGEAQRLTSIDELQQYVDGRPNLAAWLPLAGSVSFAPDNAKQNLEEIPIDMLLLVVGQIHSVVVCDHQIRQLPDSFGHLQALRSLSLRKNQLTFLPESIGTLHNLEDMDISHNQIKEIPTSISMLKKLRYEHALDSLLTNKY